MDLERLITRVLYGSANARDLVGLKESLKKVPVLKEHLGKKRKEADLIDIVYEELDELKDVTDLIDGGIMDDPPLSVREGGLIKQGCDEQLDELRDAATHGKKWIKQLEAKEKKETNIKTLRVGFNKVFGYYLEVSKKNINLVPDSYIRKQTLANCERYVTQDLKEMEDKILSAQEKSEALEYKLFCEIRDEVARQAERIRTVASAISRIDCLSTLAEIAVTNNYRRPELTEDDTIAIKNGRHPVVEHVIQEGFVPNDALLDCEENQLLIITGPNMAGKSTYMRQVAEITILAQMGSFVPAEEARIGIVDRIFTRVGAFDDLVRGQSTFMVEMTELANILNNASKNSLILLDEIGRGTSTFDGLSIAWAVCEYIHNEIGSKTLFATHYHQLTTLEDKHQGVKNYNILVKETESSIAFLRKIAPGSTDRSYGIEVAKIAGVPKEVIDNANKVLEEIEGGEGKVAQPIIERKPSIVETARKNVQEGKKEEDEGKGRPAQMILFPVDQDEHPVVDELRHLDPNNLTPLEALTILYNLKKKAEDKR
jgi:DNA mismatch repair protein MutS